MNATIRKGLLLVKQQVMSSKFTDRLISIISEGSKKMSCKIHRYLYVDISLYLVYTKISDHTQK